MLLWEIVTFVFAGVCLVAVLVAMIGSIKHDREMTYKWNKIFKEEGRDA